MVQQQDHRLVEVALALTEHVGVCQQQAAGLRARQLMGPLQLVELAAVCYSRADAVACAVAVDILAACSAAGYQASPAQEE